MNDPSVIESMKRRSSWQDSKSTLPITDEFENGLAIPAKDETKLNFSIKEEPLDDNPNFKRGNAINCEHSTTNSTQFGRPVKEEPEETKSDYKPIKAEPFHDNSSVEESENISCINETAPGKKQLVLQFGRDTSIALRLPKPEHWESNPPPQSLYRARGPYTPKIAKESSKPIKTQQTHKKLKDSMKRNLEIVAKEPKKKQKKLSFAKVDKAAESPGIGEGALLRGLKQEDIKNEEEQLS